MALPVFLRLPQELRDLIYHYALLPNDEHASINRDKDDRQPKRLTVRNDRWQWNIYYSPRPPTVNYLSLMQTCTQLHRDIQKLLHSRKQTEPARLSVLINYPNIIPTWTRIPGPAEDTTTLDILVKVDQLYHPAYVSRPPHNAIHTAVFEILKQYIHCGPHFARRVALSKRLHLKNVRITLAPPQPLEDMTYIYGFPAQQLQTLYREFRNYMAMFARSGIPDGDVDALEIQVEGKDYERLPVTSSIHDEQDYLFFKNGGFSWAVPVTHREIS